MALLPLLAAGNDAPPSSRSQSFPKWQSAVINITSISGVVKLSQNHYGYNASKSAANHITRMLAHELNFRSTLGGSECLGEFLDVCWMLTSRTSHRRYPCKRYRTRAVHVRGELKAGLVSEVLKIDPTSHSPPCR